MVCYARPASRMAALLLVVFLVFGRSAAHFLDATALLVAIAVAVGGAAVAAAVAFAVFRAVQRRQAAAGGCVSCQLRCQHAMTEQPRRLVMVSIVDRGADKAGRPGGPAAGPRWPDRPAIALGRPRGLRWPRGQQCLPRSRRPSGRLADMAIRLGSTVINCADIELMTRFWSQALGLVPSPAEPGGDFRVLRATRAISRCSGRARR